MKSILKQSVFFAFLVICLSAGFYFGILTKTFAEEKTSVTPDAAAVYKKHCATCHGKDGRAKSLRGRFSGAKNLTEAEWQSSVTDEHIFNVISNGKKKMPAFSKKITSDEINSLVTYVRGLKK